VDDLTDEDIETADLNPTSHGTYDMPGVYVNSYPTQKQDDLFNVEDNAVQSNIVSAPVASTSSSNTTKSTTSSEYDESINTETLDTVGWVDSLEQTILSDLKAVHKA